MARALIPAGKEEIGQAVTRLMQGYPQLRSMSVTDVTGMAEVFVGALLGLPLWAVRQACMDIATGGGGVDPTWPPTAPQMRKAADAHVLKFQHERGDLDIVLNAHVFVEPSPEEQDRIEAGFKALLSELSAPRDRDRSEERQAAIDAVRLTSDRLRARDLAKVGITDELGISLELRAKLERYQAEDEAARKLDAAE